ncbi:MAG: DUF4410 domain-containing protein [Candidatus Hodarchaeales archaeon]|jgi:hypothetical protein
MKKVSLLFINLVLIFTIGCAATIHETKKSNVSIANYDKAIFMQINVDEFWNKNPELKNNEKWIYQVNRASEHITKKVSSYLKKEWGSEGTKELKVQAELFMFNPGSKAARYLIGFGAGKGKIGYHVKLLDGNTNDLVAAFDAYGTLAMGVFGGDIGVAYDQCATAIIKYMQSNRL